MNRRSISALLAFAMLSVVAAVLPARAAFHIMKISEVFAGTASDANIEFIELQLWAGGQNQVSGHPVRVYDAAGILAGTYTFASNVPNGANNARILLATSSAQTYFGVTADLLMATPSIAAAGGAACFDSNIDCVSWGNYTGTAHTSPTGAPFAGGIPAGQSIERKPGTDANNSATDFQVATPSPTNNAGQTGAPSGVPAFTADVYPVHETAGSVTITAQRGDTSQPITVTYETLDGTATSGQDYTATSGSLSYAISDASESFGVPILEDGVTDADEQFTVRLKDGTTVVDTATVLICGDLPGAPRSLTATASGQSTINLSWQTPLCAGDSAVTNYVIYEGTSPNPTTVLTTVGASPTTYARTGLPAGVTRYYKVAAVNAVGTGAQSNQAQATTASNDTRAPAVRFTTPNNSVIVAGMPAIAGEADDDQAVTTITAAAYNIRGLKERDLNVTCTGCGTALAQFTVSPTGLLPGVYLIRVTARDPAVPVNKTASADLTVVFVS